MEGNEEDYTIEDETATTESEDKTVSKPRTPRVPMFIVTQKRFVETDIIEFEMFFDTYAEMREYINKQEKEDSVIVSLYLDIWGFWDDHGWSFGYWTMSKSLPDLLERLDHLCGYK